MKFPWKKRINVLKTPNEMRAALGLKPVTQEDIIGNVFIPQQKAEEVSKMDETKLYTLFEEAAESIMEFESVIPSPLDGSLIGVVRTTDVLNALAESMGIDIKQTGFEHYAK